MVLTSFLFSVSAEKQRDVQRARGGGRGLGPDERGLLQDSDGRHRGAPGGGGAGVNSLTGGGEGKADVHVELCSRGDRRVLQCWRGWFGFRGSPDRLKLLTKE